jgi:hypothetical protein
MDTVSKAVLVEVNPRIDFLGNSPEISQNPISKKSLNKNDTDKLISETYLVLEKEITFSPLF